MKPSDRTRDEWLALRCQAGEPGAFEELVATMERPLLYFTSRLARDPQRALDVLQEVWLKAFREIRRLRDPGALRPWLYRIAHGIAVDQVRRNLSRERAETTHIEAREDPGEVAFQPEDAAALHWALDQLDVRHREVLILHFLEDFSVGETAQALECPEGTVKSRLHHAKKAMRNLLTGERHAIIRT